MRVEDAARGMKPGGRARQRGGWRRPGGREVGAQVTTTGTEPRGGEASRCEGMQAERCGARWSVLDTQQHIYTRLLAALMLRGSASSSSATAATGTRWFKGRPEWRENGASL
ncbi:hypothetical protein MPTK1_1g14090 [Marchantia polymorpha subsp. ruderalis]|uniref:Uncharacterized protein n=2 Tax=Marchantia polymorpha TaxID=3197 RepID=A0AAF6APY9_MARPO|nr:hypothetical protein MARPO_0019s0179 [Marchantia polymorpha]BBM98509.1 hypothetical protein Mp_1g14090 [Marchantia polymorpha subsp. ruderalis]|eukprot:PTQ44780.1 hypothetical protein MARPO_0019s0179 [Marchantia polymorpha]